MENIFSKMHIVDDETTKLRKKSACRFHMEMTTNWQQVQRGQESLYRCSFVKHWTDRLELLLQAQIAECYTDAKVLSHNPSVHIAQEINKLTIDYDNIILFLQSLIDDLSDKTEKVDAFKLLFTKVELHLIGFNDRIKLNFIADALR